MAAPAVAAYVSTTNSGTFSKPTGTASGDVLVACGLTYDITSAQTFSLSGWTSRLSVKDSGNGVSGFIADRLCDGTEGASFAPTLGFGTYHDWIILRLTGCHQTTWYDTGSTNSGTTETTLTATGITTGFADEILIVFQTGYNFYSYSGTPWSGYTQQAGGANDGVNYVYTKSQAAAGATGSPTAALSGATNHWTAILAGYRSPAAAAVSEPGFRRRVPPAPIMRNRRR